ncbi:trifunctional serine/threonine-protein kinase/ATP-binding protein/sensor histidine kinase [Paraburkholderia caballeronis]|uniref:histidine kinase n=1 Tax=Paraburkholderia caballeronis TaxID=416943 RepID=A0A1H7L7G1_9BURK|nr:AAA family ATPase [Paraburkholderia caballeronis]PXW28322.1 PAS domain S-box-containing protein [Paraburkholderia caballeronis]PXX03688.1 PAS domain S-box-containing protein [Paraburkholderia caballeronis]RAK04432.1 PAS domain S-box-containing protein [Paraburkholderia caballeronis]SED80390.1 PAS domain S-box-containing protein [Paraburkholderia caballeronis]SEK94774.1 PAS domain S-box-containing protein [Paraburkholderia caballeronis]
MNVRKQTTAGAGGFEVTWQDGACIFCRGWSEDTRDMLGQIALPDDAASSNVGPLAHEFGLRARLDSTWAVEPLALARLNSGQTVLILHDPGGEPLGRVAGAAMSIESFLTLAAGLAAALREVHQAGLIHQDVRPANVFWNEKSGQAWLTGFGHASSWRVGEDWESANLDVTPDALPYMAPEKTGRLNRPVDARSDLYSFGVTLYRLACGRLPLVAADIPGWVYAHIVRVPAELAGFAGDGVPIPAAISAIVMKLLAKAPEDRYQTAASVESDLRECLAQWKRHGRIEPFALDARDSRRPLGGAQRLYGREREKLSLLRAFDDVVERRNPVLAVVSGHSGVGKSSLVDEFRNAVMSRDIIFVSGKFDQHKRGVPYATSAQAFQTLIRHILTLDDTEVDQWRATLQAALGENGRLILDLIPELEFIVGEQPEVPDLPPLEAQNRFHLTFRSFLGAFARREHPLVFFFDDLQWSDAATLRLIEDLCRHSDSKDLLLIGAFRQNEVDASHPLYATLQSIEKQGLDLRSIVLEPLSSDAMLDLVSDAVHCSREEVESLAGLVHDRTAGNPFFAVRLLNALCDEGLLAYDAARTRWTWDLVSIEARQFGENMGNLIAGKLRCAEPDARALLKVLACIGLSADDELLLIASGMRADTIERTLRGLLQSGLIERWEGAFRFAHDHVLESAYSLISAEERPRLHLQIGRALLEGLTPAALNERIFDVVTQLNRGVSFVTDWDERLAIARLNLDAARKAKAAVAYASACHYLSQAIATVGDDAWSRSRPLARQLWLELAECEFLSGNFPAAGARVDLLLSRSETALEKVDAYRIKVDLHVVKSEYSLAIESALECLRLLGIDMPAYPARSDVVAEYDRILKALEGRSVRDLADLPLNVDPQVEAMTRMLSALFAPAVFASIHLASLVLCRIVELSVQRGNTEAAAVGYGWFGVFLGTMFRRYGEGYQFAELAGTLVEKHGFVSSRARTFLVMEIAALWTKPIETGMQHLASTFRSGIESGDLTYACYSRNHLITNRLLRGDPLDEVWKESLSALAFVRAANFRDVVDIIVSQQRFILSMTGGTNAPGHFGGEDFDESGFEERLGSVSMDTLVCWYWILKLEARFIVGDFRAAFDARQNARRLIESTAGHVQLLNYHYYGALVIAAMWTEEADLRDEDSWGEQMNEHVEQLEGWAKNGSSTFADKYELAAAELARLSGDHFEAMRRYERAVQTARNNGFVHYEAVASETAARFYQSCGLDTNASAYLRNARACFAIWGAGAKVRQLDLSDGTLVVQRDGSAVSTDGTPLQLLDVAMVVDASLALSGEIEQPRLIDRLMTIALRSAGADRGLLVLSRPDGLHVAAAALATGDEIVVERGAVAKHVMPETLLRYAARTRTKVIIDDAASPHGFSEDDYLANTAARSILCLPFVRQGVAGAILYLENSVTPRVFTAERTALLEVLASQAAISLENARLYSDLRERESRVRRLVDSNIIGIFIWDDDDRIIDANEAFMRIIGYERSQFIAGAIRWTALTPDLWCDRDEAALRDLAVTGSVQPYEKEYLHKDGSRVPVLVGKAAFGTGRAHGVAFVLDLTELKRAQQEIQASEQRLRAAQLELSHANRVATMGQLSGSISHEVRQPIAAAVVNADAALRWLSTDPPNLLEVRAALLRASAQGTRAAEVMERIHAFFKKAPQRYDRLNLNDIIGEVVALSQGEAEKHNVAVLLELTEELPEVSGDRVQLQQVILNLFVNAVDALSGADEWDRQIVIRSRVGDAGSAIVTVEDSGCGLDPTKLESVFEAFHTTKPDGLGMGLSISRGIIETHGGRIWATANVPRGAIFHFCLPARQP